MATEKAHIDPYTKEIKWCGECNHKMIIGGSNDELYVCLNCGREYDRVSALENSIDKLNELLTRALIIFQHTVHEDDPCTFDHHGYCQAHSWFYDDEKCPDARAKELLKECNVDI